MTHGPPGNVIIVSTTLSNSPKSSFAQGMISFHLRVMEKSHRRCKDDSYKDEFGLMSKLMQRSGDRKCLFFNFNCIMLKQQNYICKPLSRAGYVCLYSILVWCNAL